jgi:hypothetical protein
MRLCNINIHREGSYVSAMGHRVSDVEGGVRELQRRCLETLSRLDLPPDEIRFVRIEPALEAPPVVIPPAAEPEAAEPELPEQERPPTIPARPQPKGPGVAKAKGRGPGLAKAKAPAGEKG